MDADVPAHLVREALRNDRTIDIVTVGAKTGMHRATEIWFMNIDGAIYICGTPSKRDWLANLQAEPNFEFCFKESIQLSVPAQATEVTDADQRAEIMSAPETQWYRDQVDSLDDLVNGSPIVSVQFTGAFSHLNP